MVRLHSSGISWEILTTFLLLGAFALSAKSEAENRMTPSFILEPPDNVAFTNSTPMSIQCSAHGEPQPSITWVHKDGSLVDTISGLREVFPNGTLMFYPFRSEDFRPDIHVVPYRCVASNSIGYIFSRLVHVRAVVLQHYAIQVHDVTALQGNAAIFQCNVPSLIREYIVVTSWMRDEDIIIETSNPIEDADAKHTILPSGELFIKNVQLNENGSLFRCQTINRLTGESRTSNNSGRLIINRAEGGIAPKIAFSKAEVTANEFNNVVIPCVAEGNPTPEVMWYARLADGLLLPIHFGGRMKQIGAGLLIQRAQVTDSGDYICDVKNGFGNARGETAAVILEPISVSIQPNNQTVDVGSSAIFRCLISGHPITTIKWLKNGEPLKTSSEELSLASVKWSDAGIYQCFAENSHRSAQAVAQLLLGDISPEFRDMFKEANIDPGTNTSMTCSAIGSPVPKMTWLLDDRSIDDDDRYDFDEFVDADGALVSTLSINNTQTEDGGIYNCIATNKVSSVKHSARLNVYGPISIRPMAPISAVTGQSVIVHCPVFGYPITSIKWWKDEELLPQNLRQNIYPNGTLVITEIRRGMDAGRYTCVASNDIGETEEQDIKITVLVPPKLLPFTFQDQLVREGMRARLQCVVSEGDIPLFVKWYKDGRPIPHDSDMGISIRDLDEFSSILTIRSVTPQHNGNYTCSATNDAASVSHSAELYINVAPKILPFSFLGGHLFYGVLARVSCVVFQGDLPLTITWTKDGHPFPIGSGINVTTFDEYSSILTIGEVMPKHSGNYTCVAKNHAAVATHTAELIVNVPPRWKLKPQDTTVIVGQDAFLHCQAEGIPEPSVSWMWSTDVSPGAAKKVITKDDRHHLYLNGSLAIKKSSESQKGYYFCRAVNNVGPSISAVAYLAVKFPARLDTWQTNLTVHHGKSFVLECKASGDFPMNFTWSKANKKISAESDRFKFKEIVINGGMLSELTVNNVIPDDSVVFGCLVENSYGMDNSTFFVTVQEKPDPPATISVNELGSRFVNISWIVPFDGHSKISSYSLEYKRAKDYIPSITEKIPENIWETEAGKEILDTENNFLEIVNLQPASGYFLRIFANNDVGTSKPSPTIAIQTKEEAPSGAPTGVTVEALNSKTLRVCWKPPEAGSWNGALKGYWVGHKIWGSSDLPVFKSVLLLNITKEQCANITGLRKFIRYAVVVQSFNDKGRGPGTEEILAMTAEGVPTESAINVACTPLSSESIKLSWQPTHMDRLNGILQGYRVFVYTGSGNTDGNYSSMQNTTAEEVTIESLEKFSNYSFKLTAFTKAGDGTPTDFVTCRTMEDVPGPPAAIRAMVVGSDAVLVTWKPPLQSNGIVTQYNVHMKEDWQKSQGSIQWAVSSEVTQHDISNLKQNQKYSFWVTASTSAGEGAKSKVVTLIPKGPLVPAQAISFDETVQGKWNQRLTLPCKAVGNPAPSKNWLFGDSEVKVTSKLKVYRGTLVIIEAQGYHSGNYTCQVKNKAGKDRIRYSVNILAPPSAPKISLNFTTRTSIQIEWIPGSNNGAEIKGYSFNFCKQGSTLEQIDLDPDLTSYELTELQCGTFYEIFLVAFNDIGTGEPSNTIKVATNGSVPELPQEASGIEEGATSLIVHLDKAVNGDCPVNRYVVEYKSRFSDLWLVGYDEMSSNQKTVIISDLLPGSWYNLRLVARTNAGTATAEYEVATLALNGGTVNPSMETAIPEDGRSILFYIDLRIVIPIAAGIGLLLLALVIMCVCVEKKKEVTQQSPRKVQKADKLNNSHLARRSKEPEGVTDSFTYLRRTNMEPKRQKNAPTSQQVKPTSEDLAPYATFHLNNGTELQTFQQRTSAPAGQVSATDTEDETLERVKLHGIQQFPTRPKSYTPGYANILAESPSTGKKKLRQVAIPTAPVLPVIPGLSPISRRGSQGSQASIGAPPYPPDVVQNGAKSQLSRPGTPNSASSTPALKHRPLFIGNDTSLPVPPPKEMAIYTPDTHKQEVSLPLPPNMNIDVSPVYSNVADAKEFLSRS